VANKTGCFQFLMTCLIAKRYRFLNRAAGLQQAGSQITACR
jgi:hypothetical protein